MLQTNDCLYLQSREDSNGRFCPTYTNCSACRHGQHVKKPYSTRCQTRPILRFFSHSLQISLVLSISLIQSPFYLSLTFLYYFLFLHLFRLFILCAILTVLSFPSDFSMLFSYPVLYVTREICHRRDTNSHLIEKRQRYFPFFSKKLT